MIKMVVWKKYHAQFYGITQTGKTTQGLRWLCSDGGLRIFIDTKNEMSTNKEFREIFNFIAPLSDIDIVLKHYNEFIKNNIKIALIPNVFYLDKEMKYFCEQLWKRKRNNKKKVRILFDEIQQYSCNKEIRSLFVQGLAKNLFCALTSQGWSQVKKNIRNNCEITGLLKQRQNDIDSLMEQGFIPYKLENGRRVNIIDFSEPYVMFIEIGSGGKFLKVV